MRMRPTIPSCVCRGLPRRQRRRRAWWPAVCVCGVQCALVGCGRGRRAEGTPRREIYKETEGLFSFSNYTVRL
jgi:hypothetical protein